MLFTTLIALAAPQFALGENITHAKVTWKQITANVVYVNMDSPNVRVTPALAKKGTGSSESFRSMVDRLHPTAAITGTFFCTRSLQPTGDIVIEGKRMHSGCVGTALCITDDGQVQFRTLKDGRSSGWQGCRTVICAGPTLVRDGKMALAPKAEGFKDPEIFRRKPRAAVAYTSNNKLLMVTVSRPILLSDLAGLLLHLGASDAVDLDGGSSTALYYRGSMINRPTRSLTNLLVAYETPEQYAAYRSQLAPDMPTMLARSTHERASRPATALSDGALIGMFVKTPNPRLTQTPYWDVYRPFAERRSDVQTISARPE